MLEIGSSYYFLYPAPFTPAVPAMRAPMENMLIAAKNSCLVVNLRSKNAVTGIITPFVSINPVVIHCTVLADIENSRIIDGKAVMSSV